MLERECVVQPPSYSLPGFLSQHFSPLLCRNLGMFSVVSFLSVSVGASSSSVGSWGQGCSCVVFLVGVLVVRHLVKKSLVFASNLFLSFK